MNTVATRLRAARDAGRGLLVPYLTGGVTADWTDYLPAYQAAGADAIEIGLPFSDPMLDGTTIQQASHDALARGATVATILADLTRIADAVTVPLIAMTYANLVVHHGSAPFCAMLRAAGITGLIVPDLPVDEADELSAVAVAAGVDLVLLAAPSTRPDRLAEICRRSRGFVYAVSVMGTTGERATLADSARVLATAVKTRTDLPVLLGFGVADRVQAAQAGRWADGVVVGAALMRRVLDGASPASVGAALADIRLGLDESG